MNQCTVPEGLIWPSQLYISMFSALILKNNFIIQIHVGLPAISVYCFLFSFHFITTGSMCDYCHYCVYVLYVYVTVIRKGQFAMK